MSANQKRYSKLWSRRSLFATGMCAYLVSSGSMLRANTTTLELGLALGSKIQSTDTNLESPVPVQSETVTQQLNENPVAMVTSFDSKVPEPPRIDDSFNIKAMLARPRRVRTVAWTTSDGYDTALSKFRPLDDLYAFSPFAQSTFNRFVTVRGTMHVRFDINGSPYHAGRVLASWATSGNAYRTGYTPTTLTNIALTSISQRSTLPNVWLNPSSTCSYEISKPLISMLGGVAPQSDYPDRITLSVVNPLKFYGDPAATTTGLVINVSVWMTDVELIAPTPESERDGLSGHVIPNITKKIQGYASTFARAAINDVLTSVGLGSPSVVTPIQMVNEQRAPRIKSDVPARAEKLALHQGMEDEITPLFSSGTDPMDFKSIYTREAFVTRATWTDSQTGFVLGCPVTPMISDGSSYTSGAASGGTQLMPMGFVAAPFQYWRGDIEFRIEVVAPKFVRGRLKLVYLPESNYGTTYASGTDTADLRTVYVDVSESTTASMVIPYMGETPWKNVTVMTPVAASNPPVDSNGGFYVEIVEPLRSSGKGVEINLFARAVHLEVAAPGNLLSDMYLGGTVFADPQGVGQELDSFTNIRDIIKAPQLTRMFVMTATADTGVVAWQFNMRACPNYRNAASDAAGKSIVDELGSLANIDQTRSRSFTNYLAWYSAAFLARKGSIRYNIVPCQKTSREALKLCLYDVATGTMQADYLDTDKYLALLDFSHGAFYIQDATCSSSYTVDVPPMTATMWTPARMYTGNTLANTAAYVICTVDVGREDTTPGQPMYMILTSAADDYSLDGFQFVPIYYSASTYAT